ncbi:MAG: sulfatase-like hydrolase/transferase [Gemmatimonadetes bacterium]|nr:sulfatase-like hydrolase/transferase [Gemmatimonadota bacterium]
MRDERSPARADSGGRIRPIIALWLAVLASVCELAILAYRNFGRNEIRVWSSELVWMGPIVYVAGFALLFLLLAMVRRVTGRPGPRTTLGILAGAAAISILLNFPLHRAASFLLGAGVAVQFARWAWRHRSGFERVVQATALPSFAVLFAIAMWAALAEPIRERRMLSGIPAAPAGSPNVLMVILDTVRDINLSAWGYDRRTTPELERIAARSVRFANAFSVAPWTLPGHVGLFSGRFPHEMATDWQENHDHLLPDGAPVLAEVLRGLGYTTAGFVANLVYATDEFGLDAGFAHYEDFNATAGQFVLSTAPGRAFANNGRWRRWLDYHDMLNRKTASRVNADFLDWLEGADDRPFFAFLNYFDAHEPYLPRTPFDTAFGATDPAADYNYQPNGVGRARLSAYAEREIAEQLARYDAAIAYMDREIGRLLEELERRSVLENTIVIIASDHGEMFGEHGMMGHIGRVYSTVIGVPLLISWPRVLPSGRVIEEPVSTARLPATIHDLLIGGAGPFPGLPLRELWEAVPGSAPGGLPVLSEGNPGRGRKSLVLGDYHFIRRYDTEVQAEELFDMSADPLEQNNLADDPALDAVADHMRALLDSAMAASPPAEPHRDSGDTLTLATRAAKHQRRS